MGLQSNKIVEHCEINLIVLWKLLFEEMQKLQRPKETNAGGAMGCN